MADSGSRNGWLKLACVAVVVAVLAAVGYRWSNTRDDAEVEAIAEDFIAASEPVEVHYLVDGTADGAEVTMTTPDGVESESVGVLPLGFGESGPVGRRYEFAPGAGVAISAHATGGGTLTCTITAVYGPGDNVTVAENESDGGYVACEGIVD
jgi:hypothetical protein